MFNLLVPGGSVIGVALGVALLLLGAALWRRLDPTRRPLRQGPWPGLSPAGGSLVLVYAVLIMGAHLLAGAASWSIRERTPLPYLPWITAADVFLLVHAAYTLPVPGLSSAVAGAYLLPRSLVSLGLRDIALPPLLLPAAMMLDVVLWTRAADLLSLRGLWPRRGSRARRHLWRPRTTSPRKPTVRRSIFGGALYGLLLVAFETPTALLLGAPGSVWTADAVGVSAVVSAAVGAVSAGLVASWHERTHHP